MERAQSNALELQGLFAPETRSVCIGQIVQITAEGQALVDYLGNPGGQPIAARSVVAAPRDGCDDLHHGTPVLLVFENGDLALPIIVGVVRNTLYPRTSHEQATLSTEHLSSVILDGQRIIFDAKEEIVLRCGKSSVTLRKDGKVVVKGTHLVSRASETNKIKGASVSIN